MGRGGLTEEEEERRKGVLGVQALSKKKDEELTKTMDEEVDQKKDPG